MCDYSIGPAPFIDNDAGRSVDSPGNGGNGGPPNGPDNSLFDLSTEAFMQPDWAPQPQGSVDNSAVETGINNAQPVPNGLAIIPPTSLPSPHDSVVCGIHPVRGPTNAAAPSSGGASSRGDTSRAVSQSDLRQSFMETYFNYCYPWCPVLDRSTLLEDLAQSPILDNALALVGTHVHPPLIPLPGPASYYDRARRLFYDDEEDNILSVLKAVSLFYWWAPRPPSVAHKHSSWWWTGIIIKLAQQAGFHRETTTGKERSDIEFACKRRIWWTAFVSDSIATRLLSLTVQARERLTAICQGKPCLIDPDDCSMPPPSLEDFPELEDKTKAEVFIHWVRLCTIIGRIAKELSRHANASTTPRTALPVDLGMDDLIEWIRSLPQHLQLPIGAGHTLNFNRDIHQMHLPYLAVIVVLHLTRSAQSLPQALPPATLAGSCIARILKDVLMRSEIRFLMPITCWYVGMGFIGLLQASRSEHLKEGALADLEILMLAIKQLKNMWATAAVFEQTFDRLRSNNSRCLSPEEFPNRHLGNEQSTRALHSEQEVVLLQSGIDWMEYFPFVTAKTSLVAERLLARQNIDVDFWNGVDETAFSSIPHFQDFMGGLDSWVDPASFT